MCRVRDVGCLVIDVATVNPKQFLISKLASRRVRRECFQFLFSDGRLDLTVDLRSNQEHQAGDVEPGEQNNDGAERSISQRIAVCKVDVEAKSQRGEYPANNPKGAPWCKPMPATSLHVGSPIVDHGET